MNWIVFQLFVFIELSLSLAPSEIVVLIFSQSNAYYNEVAQNLRAQIYNQSALIDNNNLVNVYLSHEAFHHPGHWSFLTVLPKLSKTKIISHDIKWLILCDAESYINLELLLENLEKEDAKKVQYFGYPLYDQEATIVHHFAFFENPQWFPYPMTRAGIIFSIPLINLLIERAQNSKLPTDFFIDASHELSLFIWQNVKVGNTTSGSSSSSSGAARSTESKTSFLETNGNIQEDIKLEQPKTRKILLTRASFLCPEKGFGCAIYPSPSAPLCHSINPETIYFAIKTCQKFHKERIPTIKMTWGRYAIHKNFFSDVEDRDIPTIATGIPNTETGHCGKTLSILKLVLRRIGEMNQSLKRPIEWIFLSDDDTLLSVSKLSGILGCFNASDDLYLGERYGYRLHSKDGFNYITGGGGIAFTIPTVKRIVSSCTCPSISSPDDMIIGICLQRQGIPATHSVRFHQARPPDYSPKLLQMESPISFHKYWQIDPHYVYEEWFKEEDNNIIYQSKKNCDISTSPNGKLQKNLSNGRNIENKSQKSKTQHIDL